MAADWTRLVKLFQDEGMLKVEEALEKKDIQVATRVNRALRELNGAFQEFERTAVLVTGSRSGKECVEDVRLHFQATGHLFTVLEGIVL